MPAQLPYKQSFKKNERLKSSKAIEQLFEKGTSVSEYPFKFLWLPSTTATAPMQTCIAVPKRKIRQANGRNLIKRRIKESFRRCKGLLYEGLETHNKHLSLVILYTGPPDMAYAKIDEALQRGLQKLAKQHEANT
ncbi:hypothetical protein BH09BAC1_BH09BAC1_13730 [soil metagenome]